MNNFSRVMIITLAFFLFMTVPVFAGDAPSTAVKNYDSIAGEWQRTDSNYVIKVSDVTGKGQAKVEYFNPRPIHVASANISTEKDLIKLFVKFQDKGYEGSTYRLYYYADKDALLGFYHQAPTDRTFEVIFLRKKI